jgi:hypothetical protein
MGKAGICGRLATFRRRRVRAGSGQRNESGNSDGGELHDEEFYESFIKDDCISLFEDVRER